MRSKLLLATLLIPIILSFSAHSKDIIVIVKEKQKDTATPNIKGVNVKSTKAIPMGYKKLLLDGESSDEVIEKLTNSQLYESIELDVEVYTPKTTAKDAPTPDVSSYSLPNDPYYNDYQHYYFRPFGRDDTHTPSTLTGHNITGMWDKATSSNTVRIGVVDGGFKRISDINWADESADFHNQTNDAFFHSPEVENCEYYHGTGVAGTIGAIVDNNEGTSGVAVNTQIVAAKALECNVGSLYNVSNAILWLAGNVDAANEFGIEPISEPVDVINLSLGAFLEGGDDYCPSYTQGAIDYATSKGIQVYAAAGNDGSSIDGHTVVPASCKNTFSVAALDNNGDKALFSNYSTKIDMALLGVNITAPMDTGVGLWDGTSFSTPLAAGVGATIARDFPNVSHALIQLSYDLTSHKFEQSTDCYLLGDVCSSGIMDAGALYESLTILSADSQGSIHSPFSSLSECEIDMYSEHLGLAYPYCEHFEISINEEILKAESFAKIYKLPIGVNINEADIGQYEILTYQSGNKNDLRISTSDFDAYEFKFKICSSTSCETHLFNLDLSEQLPSCITETFN